MAWLVAEIGVRAYARMKHVNLASMVLRKTDQGMIPEGRYVSAPFLPFALRPNSVDTVTWTRPDWPELEGQPEEHVWVTRTNQWGFRGRDIERVKGDSILRVVCLGGSTTYDTATEGETWPEMLEAELDAIYAPLDVQVLNLGMNAASLPFNIVNLALTGIHFQPDLVIVYAGHNDLWSGLGLEGFRPDYSHRLGHWDDSRRSIQRFLPLWLMRSAAVTATAVTIDRMRGIEYDLVRQIWRSATPAEDPLAGYWAFHNDLVSIKGMAEAHGAEMLIVTPHWSLRQVDRQDALAARVRQSALEAGIPNITVDSVIPPEDPNLHIDDAHFSRAGAQIFSRTIADAIQEMHLLP